MSTLQLDPGSQGAAKANRLLRPHSKSRQGCVACKARRIKCDEGKPACRTCQWRSADCVYVTPPKRRSRLRVSSSAASSSATPAASASATPEAPDDGVLGREVVLPDPPSLSALRSKQLLDLRLMHQYGSSTVDSLAGALELNERALKVLRMDVPRLAFEHPFLMETLLCTAIIHLECTGVGSAGPEISIYRYRAIRSFRKEIENVTAHNLRALVMASTLLAATTLAADRVMNYSGLWITNWLAMPQGPRALLLRRDGLPFDRTEEYGTPPCVHTMGRMTDVPAPVTIPDVLEEVLRISHDEDDWLFRQDLREAATGIGELFGALLTPQLKPWFHLKIRSWPYTFASGRFVELIRRSRPRALIIAAYYMAFLAFLPDVWLYQGVIHRDMERLGELLGMEFGHYLEVPKAASWIRDDDERMVFMVMQVCA
ncbi:uncharacterized protein DNG_10419 [Cephalotrichum gorgonifer]|uniref:Zn(2)-C6 fungal-type domain-containing protein n=1 Tax=Cephalotrichum gorgonifer TaxID=2041049 RepID=A0AAE8T071_9PEZI|nr:uncharacterized protein DNG_10419 [Cephalotrichum gorgonifer]